jgi:hypothetical protein
MNSIFNDTYNNLIVEEDNTYSVNVNAVVHTASDDGEEDITEKVNVRFSIDMEHRSWGIREVTVMPLQISAFSVSLNVGEGNTVDINLDVSQLRVTKLPPRNYIGVGPIEVFIDEDGKVDYGQSFIQVFGV